MTTDLILILCASVAFFLFRLGADVLYTRFVGWWHRWKGTTDGPPYHLRQTPEETAYSGFRFMFTVLIAIVLMAASFRLDTILLWTTAQLGRQKTQIAVVAAVVILGIVATWYKKRNLMVYGSLEIWFGALGAYVAAGHVSSPDKVFPALATLGGCVYVIARGCTNIRDGWEAFWKEYGEERQKYYRALIERVSRSAP